MKVTDVLLNFRNALLQLIPVAEQVGIPWKRPDAYDEWDAMASVLFENLVEKVLCWSLESKRQESFQLPPYDLIQRSYTGYSTIEVCHPSLQPGRWLFHAFGTEGQAFDRIEVRQVSEDGDPFQEQLMTCGVNGAEFRLRILNPPAAPELVDDVRLGE